MLSRRNFFTISVIMLVVLFMFQLSGTAKEKLNKYQYNTYEKDSIKLKADSEINNGNITSTDICALIGNDKDNAVGSVVQQWCLYSKRNLKIYDNMDDFKEDKCKNVRILFVDSKYINADNDTKKIKEAVRSGVNVVFCNLPDFNIIKNNKELSSLLGILYAKKEKIHTKGIKLFSGLLLGGEKDYIADNEEDKKKQDMILDMPWYQVASGTKIYMTGILDKKVYPNEPNENNPAIIWRNGTDKGFVFAVNGDYLKDNTGLGIINGFVSEMKENYIYPVINAQSTVIINYPNLSEENNEKMKEVYSRNLQSVLRDVIWPSLSTINNRTGIRFTYMMSPKLDYTKDIYPQYESLKYYLKQISEQKGEAGLSMEQYSDIDYTDKIKSDKTFFKNNMDQYNMTTFYSKNANGNYAEKLKNSWKDARTIVTSYDKHNKIVSYANDTTTLLQSISDSTSSTFSEDLKKSSIQTILGYSVTSLDVMNTIYPADKNNYWEMQYKNFSANIIDFWNRYKMFDQVVISEADNRARIFLAMDYETKYSDDSIELRIKNFNKKSWFILRTHGKKISSIDGGSYKMIEDGAYLITANKDNLKIFLKETSSAKFY